MCKEAVIKAAERLRAGYKLTPKMVIIMIPFGPDDSIHVMTIRGQEHLMPELPDTYDGFPITREMTDRPQFLTPPGPLPPPIGAPKKCRSHRRATSLILRG